MNSGYAAWAARWRVPLGFAFGIAYLVFAQPRSRLLLIGGLVGLVGLAIRAYAAGCLSKNQAMATAGPYARTRNPLYFGSLIMGLGFSIAGGSWILGFAFAGLFAFIYWPVMRREAAFLKQEFGEAYDVYARTVPFFFPALRARTAADGFQWSQYRKNREYQAGLGFAAGVLFLCAKMMLR